MRTLNYISVGAALIVFASIATALRLGSYPIGVGELAVLLLFAWTMRYKPVAPYLTHPIMLFWMGFIATAGVAMLYSPLQGASSSHTAAAYIYSGCVSLMALACIGSTSTPQLTNFIKALIIVPSALLAVALLCVVTDASELLDLLKINTDFPSRLSAWSSNPNQLALLLIPMPIWIMAVCKDSNWQGVRWLRNTVLLTALFLLAICVRSDALLFTWVVGLPLLAIIAYGWQKHFNWKIFATMLVAFLLGYVTFKTLTDYTNFLAFAKSTSSSFGVGFDENKAHVRATLWRHAYEVWWQSPVIGHGPGAFSYMDNPLHKQEAHNLGFDILTQTGVIGVLMFAALYLWLLLQAFKARDPYSLTVLVALMLFSAFHFMLRQPVFSLYMIICAIAVRNGSFTTLREKPQSI